MTFPEDLYYTKDHEWLRVEEDGRTATVGITDFAQSELGDVVFVDLESEDTDLTSESVFGTVEAVKTVSELFAPVSGTIVAINAELESHPEYVNGDPYVQGWMLRLEMDDPGEVSSLLTAAEYREMVGA